MAPVWAVHVDGEYRAPVASIAEAHQAAIMQCGRQAAELRGILDDNDRVLIESRGSRHGVEQVCIDYLQRERAGTRVSSPMGLYALGLCGGTSS